MQENNIYTNILRLFLLIFFLFSLKVAGDALLKNLNISKKDDYKEKSKILRKKLILNTIYTSEIIKLCKGDESLPLPFFTDLQNEYLNNFKQLNDIKSNHIELEINLTINRDIEDYIHLKIDNDFRQSNLSTKDFCKTYDFNNFYKSLSDDVIKMEF